MKVKKVGEQQQTQDSGIKKDIKNQSKIEQEEFNKKVNPYINKVKRSSFSSKIMYYVIGGSVLLLIVFLLVYLLLWKKDSNNYNSIVHKSSKTDSLPTSPSGLTELELKKKELELRERELNIEKNKLEQNKEKQEPDTYANYNVFNGYYQVGSTFCTITSSSSGYIIRWDKG